MSEHDTGQRPTDEILVAFIDGELSAVESAEVEGWIARDTHTAERFDFLAGSSLPFQRAFAPLLEAAPQRLETMLASLPSPTKKAAPMSPLGRRSFLAAAACLVAGIAIDRAVMFIGAGLDKPTEDDDWRAVVASYLELYTPETLRSLPADHSTQVAELNTVGSRMGMALAPEMVTLPGIDFRRAQLLQYDGRPLAQLAYLDPEEGPIALCFVPSDKGFAEPRTEKRRDMNVVYWSSDRHAFMLIGYVPLDRLTVAANDVRRRLPA